MMYSTKQQGMAVLLKALILLAAFATALTASAQDGIERYGNSVYHYEHARVDIVSTDNRGGGELKVYYDQCETCYDTAVFSSDVVLETPLGAYTGLEKLATWSDRALLVSVVTETREVVGILVQDFPYIISGGDD